MGTGGLYQLGLLLTLAAGRPVFTEREYTVVAGTVVDIFDLSDATRTHVVTQADPAKQVQPPVAGVGYNLTGAEWYRSNRPASYFDFVGNGSGASVFAVTTPLSSAGTVKTLFSFANTFANLGYYSFSDTFRTYNGTTWGDTLVGAAPAGTPTYTGVIHASARSPQRSLYVKSSAASAAYAGAVNASAAALTIGAQGNDASRYIGTMRYTVLGSEWSAAQYAAFQGAIQALTGIAP